MEGIVTMMMQWKAAFLHSSVEQLSKYSKICFLWFDFRNKSKIYKGRSVIIVALFCFNPPLHYVMIKIEFQKKICSYKSF